MGSSTFPPKATVAAALFGAARQAVLGLLYGHTDERFYQRQIVRDLALGSGAIQRELRRLTDCGILRRVVEGRQTYYQANPDCPIFDELRGLIRKTFGVADVLRVALAPLAGEVRIAFLFGSVAQGHESAESDVDVLVVGPNVKPSTVYAALRPAQEQLRREVNPKVYHSDEFCRKLAVGQHFLRSVVAGPKVFLIGDERELARLVEKRMAQTAPDEPSGTHGALRSGRPRSGRVPNR